MTPKEILDLGTAAAVVLTAINIGVWLIKFLASRLDKAREDAIMAKFEEVLAALNKRDRVCTTDHSELAVEVRHLNENMAALISLVQFVVDNVIKGGKSGS